MRIDASSRTATRLGLLTAPVAVGLLGLAVVLGTGDVRSHALVLVVEAWAVLLSRRAAAGATGSTATTFRLLARAVLAMTAGEAVGVAASLAQGRVDLLSGFVLPALGALVSCPFTYQALVTWCGHRPRFEDRFEWMNSLAAVLALTSLTMTALRWAGSPVVTWDAAWLTHLWLLSTCILVVMVGTAVVVAVLLGRQQDPRLWIVAGGLGVSLLVNLSVVLVGPEAAVLFNASWATTALAVAVAANRRQLDRGEPAPTAFSATGALAVTTVALLGLAADGRGPHPTGFGTVPAWFAAAAGVVVLLRLGHLVSKLSSYAESRHQALTDDLTGIANRRCLMAGLARATTSPGPVALLVADVDGFKDVNDRHGHHRGDQLLRDLAVGMASVLPPTALLARTGGDEFAVLLPGLDEAAALDLARRLRAAALAEAVPPGTPLQRTVTVGMSVGVASVSTGAGVDTLLRQADTAMYVAKTSGSQVSVFDHEVDARDRDRAELAGDLRAMVAGGAERMAREVVVHYQPQVDVVSGPVVGVEALVRWQHPVRGLLPPLAFLDLVEELGLMDELTVHVLGRAAADAADWSDGGAPLRLSVNLSATSLAHPDLLGIVDEVLTGSGLDPHRLVLEVTETTLMDDPARALQVTHGLVGLGVQLSIDDYGTGYSSLAYLTDLPATELKLDRAFTRRLLHEARTAQIVEATVALAHGLGLRVVAEGVEDAPTLEVLLGLGVDESQGYLHSRPMPPADFSRWLAERAEEFAVTA